MRPDPTKHNPDPAYVRELIKRAGHTQRSAARAIGVGERTMRHWCAGSSPIPYTAQYALECLPARKSA